jgi:hypothetical protein
MKRIHFHPDEAIIIQFKFCTGFKFEMTPSFSPVNASRDPSHSFSLAVDKNPLKKLLFILNIVAII